MKRVPVEVTGITVCPPYQAYMLVLHELDGLRWLPIFIGQQEASNISQIMRGNRLSRPLTFDLIFNLVDTTGARVEEVVVSELRDQTFFAVVVLRLSSGGVRQVDARPSDAIAIAIRSRAPIFVAERVMVEAGQLEGEELPQVDEIDNLKQLNQRLQEAVEQEDYEEAARLRDQIRAIEPQVASGKE